MQSALRSDATAPVAQSGCSLFDIARRLGVPVVLASRNVNGVFAHASFGLDLNVDWAPLAQAIDRLCAEGAAMVANVECHDELGKWAAPLLIEDIRFLIGLPLRDDQGRRIGSIAAMASQAFVARQGISFSRLSELGKDFAGAGG